MTLALRLGKTLSEVGAMPAEEFFLWRAFDAQSPISDLRNDILCAMQAAATLQSVGMKVTTLDMLPPWSKRPDSEEPAEEEEDKAETFFAFLRGRAAMTAVQPDPLPPETPNPP